jgi:hypothetical protein
MGSPVGDSIRAEGVFQAAKLHVPDSRGLVQSPSLHDAKIDGGCFGKRRSSEQLMDEANAI